MRLPRALAVAVCLGLSAFPARAGVRMAMPGLFSWWQDRGQALPIRMEVAIEVGGRTYPVALDEAGFAAVEALLAWIFPGTDSAGRPRYAASGTWAVLQKLSDPAFEAEFVRIADLSRKQAFRVTVVADDDPDQPLTAAVGTRDGVREIRFGESRVQRDGELASFLPVLLHEVGHVADETRCRLDYGPDGAHYSFEILNPGAAFKEGWGDYLGAKLPGSIQGFVASPRPLAIEGSVAGAGRPGVYRTLEPGDLKLNDYLCNEAWVARILLDLEGLGPGRTGVERVFVATNRGSCRTLAGFLEAWVAAFPATREAVLAVLVQRTPEAGGAADYARVLGGELVGRLDPEDLPRPRDPGAAAAEDGGWLAELLDRIRKPFEPGPPGAAAEPGGLLGTGD